MRITKIALLMASCRTMDGVGVCAGGCGCAHAPRGCVCAPVCARSCECVGDLCVCTVPIVQGSEREGQTDN